MLVRTASFASASISKSSLVIFGLLIVPIFGLSSCRETDAGLQGAVSLMRHDPAEPSDNATLPRAACKNATHTPTSSNATHKPRHKDPFESRLSVGLSDDAGERSEGRKLMVGDGIEEEEAGERVGDGEDHRWWECKWWWWWR